MGLFIRMVSDNLTAVIKSLAVETKNFNTTIDLVAYNLIIDDLVFDDGMVMPGLLGGGGPQTAFGMRLWNQRVGLSASVSPDLPAEHIDWFNRAGIDQRGLCYRGTHSLRAWQHVNTQGERSHAWQTDSEQLALHFNREASMMPPAYQLAAGFHLGIHAESPDWRLIEGLKLLGGILSLETFRPVSQPLPLNQLENLLTACDIFSCNLHEGRSLTGLMKPVEIVHYLLEHGAKVITLRLGENGSIAAEASSGAAWQVPAVKVTVVDAVGAGNAYCGGFLAGRHAGMDLVTCAAYGASAASFLIEQWGMPMWNSDLPAQAQERASLVKNASRKISL